MNEISIFVSVIRSDDQITTWSEIRVIDSLSEEFLKEEVEDVIMRVKDRKKWQNGHIETIKVSKTSDYFNPILKLEEKDEGVAFFNDILK